MFLAAGAPGHAQTAPGTELLRVTQHCMDWAEGGFADATPFEADPDYVQVFAVAGQYLYRLDGTGMTVELTQEDGEVICAMGGQGAVTQGDDYARLFDHMDGLLETGRTALLVGSGYAICDVPSGLFSVTYALDGGEGLAVRLEWGTEDALGVAGACDG
ncbi:hypothetical protein [Hasllibacter sp. MH4015]|uniref:hypothetical protein n=1 Tax=Hasllibacter sp. MH4015 TaxID=2854029 RepID=UPI001CD68C08|nr:hypothetical protein [Hasllibacter sp. MH4015]